MSIEIEEGSAAKEQFKSVNADVPNGISVVPSGIDEYNSRKFIVYPDGTDTVRKLLERNGVDYVSIETEDDTSTLVLRSEELIIPTLYIAYEFVKNNWDQIEFALETLSEYYMTRYDQEVKLTVEQEKENGDTVRLTYQGPSEDMDSLSDEIASIVGREVEDERES